MTDIYPSELEIKDTTDAGDFVNYLDIRLQTGENNILSTQLFDKRDEFNFPIVNFPFVDGNIPLSPACGVMVSQLVRYARVNSLYEDFIKRSSLLASKLASQGYLLPKLVAKFKKFYGRHHDLIGKYNTSYTDMAKDVFINTNSSNGPSVS